MPVEERREQAYAEKRVCSLEPRAPRLEVLVFAMHREQSASGQSASNLKGRSAPLVGGSGRSGAVGGGGGVEELRADGLVGRVEAYLDHHVERVLAPLVVGSRAVQVAQRRTRVLLVPLVQAYASRSRLECC